MNTASSSFSLELTGLKPNTKYYYRTYAKVSGTGTYASQMETFTGTVKSFTTLAQETADPAVDEDWLELPGKVNGYEAKTVVSGGERNYTHVYDAVNHVSLWTAYPLEARHMGSYNRPDDWSYNPLYPDSDQPNLCSKSYKDSDTWVRGHLIPNASRNGIRDMQLQTFYVTNSAPQVDNGFNNGIWSSLEGALQSLAQKECIYIVTGVAFNKAGSYNENLSVSVTYAKDASADGQTKKCPVPNYFYKVVLRVKTSGSSVTSASAVGFWFENRVYSGTSYSSCAVSVDQIEQWTGFDFFVNLPDSIEAVAESNTSWSTFSGTLN